MLHCTLSIELPAELPEPKGTVDKLVAWLAGTSEEPDEELQAVLRANLTIFEAALSAFDEAGFDDVIAVVIDGRPAYLDTEEKMGDLAEALDGTVKSGMIDAGFQVLRTAFTHIAGGLRLIGEFRLHAVELEAGGKATIAISARLDDFDPREDELPKRYAARVREYIRDSSKVAAHRTRVIGLVEKLRKALLVRFPLATITRSQVVVRVIAPGPRQVARMRHLGFQAALRRTVSCSLSAHERIGPYDDPLTHHYYSPYQDLFHWIALGEVLAGHWSEPWVEVVHPTGRLMFTGETATAYDREQLDVDRNAVRVDGDGRLVIDASIPEVATVDPAEAGSPHSPGWGGEEWAQDLDSGGE